MKKIALLFAALAVIVCYQTAVWASCGQTGKACKCNFTAGNKHAKAAK